LLLGWLVVQVPAAAAGVTADAPATAAATASDTTMAANLNRTWRDFPEMSLFT